MGSFVFIRVNIRSANSDTPHTLTQGKGIKIGSVSAL